MAVKNSSSNGDFIGLDTSSTTAAIAAGLIIELDSSGDAILPTTTPANPFGVTATSVAARTTASKEKITVQRTGIAAITCAANEAFGYNDMVIPGESGVATTGPTFAGTTWGSEDARKVVGAVAEPDATTEGTTVLVALNFR